MKTTFHFLRYTFTAQAFAWWVVVSIIITILLWACSNVVHWPMVANFLGITYLIFCALYLLASAFYWLRYRKISKH